MDSGTIQALVAALIGGLGVAIVTAIGNWLTKKQDVKNSQQERLYKEASAIRTELREEIRHLENGIKSLRGQLDEWRKRYWDLYAKHLRLVAELEDAELTDEEQEVLDNMEET